MKTVMRVVFFLSLPAFLWSCFEDSQCIDLRNDVIVIAFKNDTTGKADALAILDVSIDESNYEFTVPSNPVDKISLPLNPSKNKQRVEIAFLESANASGRALRVLEIGYNVKAQFESTDCEPKFFFSTLSIVNYSETLLSAKVVDPLPQQSPNTTNIELAYR